MIILLKRYFISIALLLTLSSCELLTRRVAGGEDVVASVGETHLTRDEVLVSMPKYLVGADSLEFAQRYVDRWIKRQIKVDEAERIFSSSIHEVEMMVKSYRQTLMTQRLDRYYVNAYAADEIAHEECRRYYNDHSEIFRLDRDIVKGSILRLPLSHSSEAKMKKLMSSSSKDSRLNLISISEKSSEFELEQYTEQWIDFDDFLSKLPIVRDSKSRGYLKREGVQQLKDSEWCYLFEVSSYRSAGYVAPLELVEDRIRQILKSDRHTELIREREEQLYRAAKESGRVIKHITEPINKDKDSDEKRD